jgi:hypothetical protein
VEGIVSAFQRAVNVLEADQFTQGLDYAVGLDAVAWLKKYCLNFDLEVANKLVKEQHQCYFLSKLKLLKSIMPHNGKSKLKDFFYQCFKSKNIRCKCCPLPPIYRDHNTIL